MDLPPYMREWDMRLLPDPPRSTTHLKHAAPPAMAVKRCPATASDAEVQHVLWQAADLVPGLPEALSGKRKIIIKANLGVDEMRLHAGRQVALTDPAVLAATVAYVRRFHSGELLVGDASTGYSYLALHEKIGYGEALAPYDVRPFDMKEGPFVEFEVPGGGLMFRRYWMSREFADADAIVSVAKLKAHLSAGATGALKNLFGMVPTHMYGDPRRYLHAPVRLPRVLADVAQTFPPVLNVIDGLVGQTLREWGGEPMRPDLLIVGNNCVATDALAMHLVGMDATAEYRTWPFYFDSNPLALAASRGLGPNRLEEIQVRGASPDQLRMRFEVDRQGWEETDPVRRTIAREAVQYGEQRERLMEQHQGRYVALARGEVVGAAPNVQLLGSRTDLAKKIGRPAEGIFLKQVTSLQEDPEHLDVYAEVA